MKLSRGLTGWMMVLGFFLANVGSAEECTSSSCGYAAITAIYADMPDTALPVLDGRKMRNFSDMDTNPHFGMVTSPAEPYGIFYGNWLDPAGVKVPKGVEFHLSYSTMDLWDEGHENRGTYYGDSNSDVVIFFGCGVSKLKIEGVELDRGSLPEGQDYVDVTIGNMRFLFGGKFCGAELRCIPLGLPLEHDLKLEIPGPKSCPLGQGCNASPPGPETAPDQPSAPYQGAEPLGEDGNGVSAGSISWNSLNLADAVNLSSWSFSTNGAPGVTQLSDATRRQVRTATMLVDMQQVGTSLTITKYAAGSGSVSGGFYVPVGVPKETTVYSYSNNKLTVTSEANNVTILSQEFEQVFELNPAACIRTETDVLHGTRTRYKIAVPTDLTKTLSTEQFRRRLDGVTYELTSHEVDGYARTSSGSGSEISYSSYALSQRAVDPAGANLVTQYFHGGKAQINPDGSWTSSSSDDGLLLLSADGLPDTNWGSFPFESQIQSVSYRPWLSAAAPAGMVPDGLASCVADVVLKFTENGHEVSRNETWTAGVLTARTDSWTSTGTDGGTACRVDITRNWSSASAHTIRERWIYSAGAAIGRACKTIQENGTVKRHSYEKGGYASGVFTVSAGGSFTRTMEWDDGGLPGVSRRSASVTDSEGRTVESRTQVWAGSGWEDLGLETHSYTTALDGRLLQEDTYVSGILSRRTTYVSDSESLEESASGAAIRTEKDKQGNVIQITEEYPGAPDIVTTYVKDGRRDLTTRSAGGLSQTTTTETDLAGRTISFTDSLGTTTTSYGSNGLMVTTTRPGGGTEISTSHLDGQLISTTGSGVVATYFSYAVDGGTGFLSRTERSSSVNDVRFTTTVADFQGRETTTTRPSPTGTGTVTETRSYNNLGQLTTVAPGNGLASQRFTYDSSGQVDLSGLDMNGDGTLTISSTDRISKTTTDYQKIDARWWQVQTLLAYTKDGSSSAYTSIQRRTTSPSAVGTGGLRWTTVSIAPGGLTTTRFRDEYLATRRVEETEDSSATSASIDRSSVSIAGRLTESRQYADGQPASYTYDALGQVTRSVDARGGITRMTYYAGGQLHQSIDTRGNATTYEYHPASQPGAGLTWRVTNPENEVTEYAYDSLGRVTAVSGTGTYPITYGYNGHGELETQTTQRAGGGADTTTWHYQLASGVLEDKTYPGGNKTTYNYHPSGRLNVRTWQRGTTTTYGYDAAGVLTSTDYSDATPDVTIVPDRLGRPLSITDGAGTLEKTYHATVPGEEDDVYPAGHSVLPGRKLHRQWDAAGRRTVTTASAGTTPESTSTLDYDQGRLGSVTSSVGGSYGRSYEYYPGTAVVRKTGAETRSVDLAGNLTAIQTPDASGAALVRHAYQYDRTGRRTKATREDSTYWSYGYNPRGEVTSGRKFTGGGTSLAGHQFLYAYDLIGNRTSAQTGGDGSGGGLRTTSYTANALNQYSLIQTPETFDVIGRAPVASTVTVNSQATTRQGERFHRQLTAANATAPVWSSVSVSDGTTTQSGHRFVAKAAIEPGYDGDGNLTGDGRWDYQWDGENRLTVMTTSTIAQTAGVPYQRLVFSYDGQGRRVRKQVFDSPTGAAIDDLRFLYDGWNLLIEYRKTGSSAPAVLRSYLWGQDLAGIDSSGQPTQGAGGVGGLLGVTTGGNSYLPAYDGNGNIVAWLNSSTQVVCKQEYDPFGNRIIHEGSVDLPIGFSTKYRDEETNLLYYGYRYYDPATGRWPSRDPIEEAGGVNLYGFVGNDGLNRTDLLGLDFIAVGSVSALSHYVLPEFGSHLSISFWEEDYHCIREGDIKGGETKNNPNNWIRRTPGQRAGTISVRNNSSIKELIQLGFKKDFRVTWNIPPQAVPHSSTLAGNSSELVDISRINYSKNGDPDSYVVIYADSDAAQKWDLIQKAAQTYDYAEHQFIPGGKAVNWPNSAYGHLVLDGNYNNSNTFIHTMAAAIERKVPVWNGRPHPGNVIPIPVLDDRPSPIYLGFKK